LLFIALLLRERLQSRSGWRGVGVVSRDVLLCPCRYVIQPGVETLFVAQIVGNRRIDIFQRDRLELLGDLLGGYSCFVPLKD